MKCCEISAGQLRTQIELQRLTQAPDGAGGWTNAWTTFASPRSKWKHGSMTERQRGMQLDDPVMHRVYIRFRPDVTARDSILYKGLRYQIRGAVDIEERGKWLELSVEEGVAN